MDKVSYLLIIKKKSYRLPVKGFADFGEVSEGSLLGADSQHLGRSHDELRLASSSHVWVLFKNDVEHAIQELVVGVVTIGTSPRDCVAVLSCGIDRKLILEYDLAALKSGSLESVSETTFITFSTVVIGKAC